MGNVSYLAAEADRIRKGRATDELHASMYEQLTKIQQVKFDFAFEVCRQMIHARSVVEQKERRMINVCPSTSDHKQPFKRDDLLQLCTVQSSYLKWAAEKLGEVPEYEALTLMHMTETAFVMDATVFSQTYELKFPDVRTLFPDYHAWEFFECFFRNINPIAMIECNRINNVLVGQMCCRKTGVVVMFSIYLDVIMHEVVLAARLAKASV